MRHGESGFGTIVHEMMHQFGAYDLYPVHDSGYSGSWKGIGVWDIMASGNWNGGGDSPSLPTGPTMAAVGHHATREVVLAAARRRSQSMHWSNVEHRLQSPRWRSHPNTSFTEPKMSGLKNGHNQVTMNLSSGEGILVLLEDWAAGDSAHNLEHRST